MSFFGGGTDYRAYYEEFGGCVLSTTIDKYCYITARELPPFFEYRSKLTYSKIEQFNHASEVEHPAVRECLKDMGVENIHIVYDADLPARAGLGSSSSFAVGLHQAIHTLRGEYVSKMQLAKEAIRLEQDLLKESVGVQDQIAAAFGGFNRIDLSADRYEVHPVIICKERKKKLNDHLMLFFTGFTRIASQIAKEQINNVRVNLTQLNEMKQLVEEGERILTDNKDILEFGRLLDHTWKLKRTLSKKITNDEIDLLYAGAQKAGAIGGKLLGAGGGGFLLLFVEPEKQPAVKMALDKLLHVPFLFEDGGSKVIFYKD
jgi:D-glycero-alpha-D-manno-heptose-7-phosphate kinase